MSTHSYIPEWRRGMRRFAFSILGGLLLAFQLVLPSVAFAASAHAGDSADPPQAQAQSEVSVVRLVFDYTAKTGTNGSASSVLCTSLGVLVKSWSARTPTDFNSWVLTDGSLLNTTPSPCALATFTGKPAPTYTLSTVNVYANNVYTGNTPANALLGTYSTVPSNPFLCFATPCSNGAVLFAFHTDQPQPALDVATANTSPQFGLALTNGASTTTRPPLPLPGTVVAQQFLDPTAVLLDVTTSPNEVGMPLINNDAQLVGIRLQGATLFTSADFNAFIAQRNIFTGMPSNPLQVAWENGMTAYYAQRYSEAVTALHQVETLNPRLKAAVTFKQKATAHENNSQGSQQGVGNASPSSENTTFLGIPRTTFLIIGIVAGFLLVIALLIIVSMWARRRHELTRFKAEQAEARRNAERDVQRQQKALQQKESLEKPKQVLPLQNANLEEQKASTTNTQSLADTLCPNCGHEVRIGATYCPNCRYLLSPITHGAPPTSNISPEPELLIIGKSTASSATTSQPQQAPIKEAVLDDLAIQESLKRLWDKAGR